MCTKTNYSFSNIICGFMFIMQIISGQSGLAYACFSVYGKIFLSEILSLEISNFSVDTQT